MGARGADGPNLGRRAAEEDPEDAARRLFQDPRATIAFEAADEAEARRAVAEFGALFDAAPGVFKVALEGAKAGAETLSSDRLQGIAEIIQNADDAGATFVEFRLIDARLIAVHDGHPVTLPDVLALAMPWLSNKTDDARSIGRFGIGLTTLHSLSRVLDVHSGPYHIRLGTPTIQAIDGDELPVELGDQQWTAFSVPLADASLDLGDLLGWLARWDDGALLFLRHVREVRLIGPGGDVACELALSWGKSIRVPCAVGGREVRVERRRVKARDGRAWLVHTASVARPAGVARASKASGETVPLGLAVPMQPSEDGELYAGLPVERFRVPIRVNAPFDPMTSRAGLASTPWNTALLPLLADLWTGSVVALFATEPARAWRVIPLPASRSRDDRGAMTVADSLELLLLDRARTELAARAEIPVDGALRRLVGLAVEDSPLEDVLDPAEVASLAALPAALPRSARDPSGRWRGCLADWRQAGAPLAPVVTVEKALELFSRPGRPTEATISLAAAALAAGLEAKLALLPCVVTSSGDHVVPPATGSAQALLATGSPLAEELGLGTRLASEQLVAADDAQRVLAWLKKTGAVIGSPGNEEVLRRLAAAGNAGDRLERPLTGGQLCGLRDAFEQLEPGLRDALGRGVGRAVTVEAVSYDSRGRQVQTHARPADIYLPRAIDRDPDSFAVAAGRTPGLAWANPRYAESLRSAAGKGTGLGPQKFLGILGAERTPRLIPHPGLQRRYNSDGRRGLPRGLRDAGGRDSAMRDIWATYTLDDVASPDLRAVALGIARERKAKARRQRAMALLATVSRMLNKSEDQASVVAASDSYGWNYRGSIPAFWLWSARAIAWLDDAHGKPQPPASMRLRTQGTLAVYGPDAPGYLNRAFDIPARRDALAALGVAGEPSTRELVDRLRSLRDHESALDSAPAETAFVYQAIAGRLASHRAVPGDLNQRDLRAAFSDGPGLVHTNLGWRKPAEALLGPAVFGDYEPFAPQVNGTEQLWVFLHIRKPDIDDCLRVIGQLSRAGHQPEGGDVTVLLETLRLLDRLLASPGDLPQPTRRRLATVSLWTTLGWTRKRPVYAIDDPALFEGLRPDVPVWDPGGNLAQFGNLLKPLRITTIRADAATVVAPEVAAPDDEQTALLQAAVAHLQEDLARNLPSAIGALVIRWEDLRQFEVRVDPDLRVRVEGLEERPDAEIEVSVKADARRRVLFVRDATDLRRVDGGGRAIAGLFTSSDRHRLAQAWLAAWVEAENGRTALRLKLADERAAEEQAEADRAIAGRQEALRSMAGQIADPARIRRQGTTGRAGAVPPPRAATPAGNAPRVLVDPESLSIAEPGDYKGPPDLGNASQKEQPEASGSTSSWPRPSPNGATPRGQAAPRAFTDLDKETVGLALLRKVIETDTVTITDRRGQYGLGADAQDNLGRFYELKVHLGPEPDIIRMEESEIRLALSAPDKYFLVVISNVEATDARPKVRIIPDPLHQLAVTQSGAVTLSGVRAAVDSLVYELEPHAGERPLRTGGRQDADHNL